MKMCAQTRQEGGRVRCASPIIFLLPMLPCASLPITRVSLAFRARLCANNEVAKTRTLILGHPSQHARRNAKEDSGPLGTNRKQKPLLYSLTKTEYTSKNATADTFSQTLQCSLDQLLTTIGHKKE